MSNMLRALFICQFRLDVSSERLIGQ